MIVCASDFCADAGRDGQPYSKTALWEIALKACVEIAENDVEARQSARAIARAIHVSCARSWSRREEPPNGDLQQIRPRPGQL